MVRRRRVSLIDDLDGTSIRAGKGETVVFSLDGVTYEIDLNGKNSNALRKVFKPYIAVARPARPSRNGRVKRTRVAADAGVIRTWARANGYEVNDRGRISNDIRQAFERTS
jgi:hypothetical protein